MTCAGSSIQLPGERVIQVLDRATAARGRPPSIRSDNGPDGASGRVLIPLAPRFLALDKQVKKLGPNMIDAANQLANRCNDWASSYGDRWDCRFDDSDGPS